MMPADDSWAWLMMTYGDYATPILAEIDDACR